MFDWVLIVLFTWDYYFLIPIFFSICLSVFHGIEEVYGAGGPIWANLASIVNTKVPDRLGFSLFIVTVVFATSLLAIIGYSQENMICLSLLLGARLGDAVFSHWGLFFAYLSDPNPGIETSTLYFFECVYIYGIYKNLLHLEFFLIGAGIFFMVLPTLWALSKISLKFRN